MKSENKTKLPQQRNISKIIRPLFGIIFILLIIWRLYLVFIVKNAYGFDLWARLIISGLIIGGVYSLIAIGYTLVYGILKMINFAHGELMMLGSFAGYFTFEIMNAIIIPTVRNPKMSFLDTYPILSIVISFIVGMGTSALIGLLLEKIAYRPLRKAPRIVPLISAIGASIFLQNVAQLLFSPQTRNYINPSFLARGMGWNITINEVQITLPYTGIFTLVLSILLMIGLLIMVKKSRLGKAMRAVAMDKDTAALMGIDVNQTISNTFIISGALAGAAGVMWGLHNGIVNFFSGFLPGIKAFTAAVLGGIGNIPGAMLGGMILGLVESIGPAALDISYQLKDVIAFVILIAILIFKPSGILGEILSEEKV